jgi:hypothetical protein
MAGAEVVPEHLDGDRAGEARASGAAEVRRGAVAIGDSHNLTSPRSPDSGLRSAAFWLNRPARA